MIKCNRCGNITPAGPMCQSCGAPLSSKNDAGFSQRTGAQEQSELPAWLESLRVGERPAPSAGAPPKFSTADFIDEGPLPIWMRSERNETPDPSNVPMPEHLSAFPDQAPDRGNFPPSGLAAQSLIDEKSLPSWMKENKQPSVPPTGFSASSLLQQESVPDWMKTLQPPSAAPSSYREQAGYKEQAGQFEQPARGAEPQSPGTAFGFSARDLIDQQALPSWMKPQGERNAPASPTQQAPLAQQAPQTDPTMRPGQTGGMALNQSGLSASSLLDANSLPQWMREGGNDARSRVEPPQSAWPGQMSPNSSAANTPPPWSMGQAPSQPSMQTNTTSAPGASLSASSFIDANALPEWLRNAADSRSQTGPQVDRSGGPKQGSYSVPPRVDNVRVPSRPRGSDPNSVESSEVAANVFASMLGVASTAPNYSGQQPGQAGPYQQPQQPGLGGGYQQPGQMGQSGSYQQSSLGGGYQQMGQSAIPSSPPPNLGVSGNNASQGMGGASLYGSADLSGGMQNMQSYGNSLSGSNANQVGGPSPMGSSYYAGNAAPPSSPAPASQSSGAMDDQKNGKKRGLFGAFLDWLSR